MKKIIISILIMSMLIALPVSAKSGDVLGVYYSTDILTTLNGVGIDAINIGGETLISAEAMSEYGYSVIWDDENRALDIYSNSQKVTAKPDIEKPTKPAGTVLGNYYETDIVTSIDGTPVSAFNIGGRTYIHAEKLRDIGFDVIWNPEKWTLSVVSPKLAGNVYSIPLYFSETQNKEGIGSFSLYNKYDYNDSRKSVVTCTGDAEYFDCIFSRNNNEYIFTLSFYQTDGLFYSTELQQKLNNLCYDGLGIETPSRPEDKYEAINDILKISVNGNVAQNIEIYKGGGNGHRDYIITVKDLPLFKESEIEEFYISLDGETGEPFELMII